MSFFLYIWLQLFLAIPHKAFKISRIHSLFSKSVADPLAGHAGNHEGDNVLQSPRQLKHDHHQGHWGKEKKRNLTWYRSISIKLYIHHNIVIIYQNSDNTEIRTIPQNLP